jgi:hypothetical protein
MEQHTPELSFTTSMLTGLFVGIIDTLLCLGFNIAYRYESGYSPSNLINVSSVIFAVNLLFLVIGIIHFALAKVFHNKDLVYIIAFVLLTVFCVWSVGDINRFADPAENSQFHRLLTGIALILGVSASFLLPYLCHNRKFLDAVI